MDPSQYALMQGQPMQPGMQMPGQPPGMPPPGGGVAGPGAPQPVQGMDPAMVQQMMALVNMQQQRAGVQRQRDLSDQLRADSMGQARGQQAGRVYKGPGVLNAVAAIAGGLKSKGLRDDADVKDMNLNTQRQSALQSYFDQITGQKRAPLPHMGDEGE